MGAPSVRSASLCRTIPQVSTGHGTAHVGRQRNSPAVPQSAPSFAAPLLALQSMLQPREFAGRSPSSPEPVARPPPALACAAPAQLGLVERYQVRVLRARVGRACLTPEDLSCCSWAAETAAASQTALRAASAPLELLQAPRQNRRSGQRPPAVDL
eukprot:3338663-Rhodomonas_salina.2